MIEDGTHEKLIKAVLEYCDLNTAFEERLSTRTRLKSRNRLREIRKLAKLRMKEIHETYASKEQEQRKNV